MTPDPGLRCVALVGPRGAGKTAVGTALAGLLGWPFADGDDLLAEAAGCPAPEFLVRVGEAGFRDLEERVTVAALAARTPAVLALGGGAVLSADVRRALALAEVFPVFLYAPPIVLIERIRRDETLRPPLTGLPLEDEVPALLEQRSGLYHGVARLKIDTGSGSPEECARRIAAALRPPV